ncbi:IclR family transcriptional regulator [Aneurinibacillus aneurinilyticus]|jgi:DNA-binding IclR family transcriptional regulator|uniref:IclR family transcriptional regulator n=1 Tax=Aneurinibacillus aneurinilyticus TaxID=1391 RepID=A0A848D1X9_ANEAE|nr:IclR family transcriptional regulator [Aneurinibacillus aneurinilyticus]MED0672250.1 IclR family transcriptional regulator [Aneurinibacillus aneurinilyticus]NMF00750.1 IclR family transcriptional regulator [Aneurinibacillus aneurinilyticus]
MVQSIDRAMMIIDILMSDDAKNGWQISELAEKTSLPLSTLHRLLSSLVQHGLVAQIPETKHYKAGYRWMEIGLRLLDNVDFRFVARSAMERLASEVEESIYLNITNGTEGIVIEKVDSPLKIRIAEDLGTRIPLHIGAPNKTILANMPEHEKKRIIGLLQLSSQEKQKLMNQLSEIRRSGYAISVGEKTEDTAAVAAPIIGYDNKVIAALSIGGPAFRFTSECIPGLIEKVKTAAAEISMKIGKI